MNHVFSISVAPLVLQTITQVIIFIISIIICVASNYDFLIFKFHAFAGKEDDEAFGDGDGDDCGSDGDGGYSSIRCRLPERIFAPKYVFLGFTGMCRKRNVKVLPTLLMH